MSAIVVAPGFLFLVSALVYSLTDTPVAALVVIAGCAGLAVGVNKLITLTETPKT